MLDVISNSEKKPTTWSVWSPTWTVAMKTRASARRSRTRRWFGVDMARLLPAFVAAPDP